MIHKDAIFDDDFDKNEVSRLNDNAKMIYGVMLDYAKAFPNSADNLSIVYKPTPISSTSVKRRISCY